MQFVTEQEQPELKLNIKHVPFHYISIISLQLNEI